MRHRGVVIAHEFSQLRLQIRYRCEVSPTQELPMDYPKYDLDLVKPRTVLRQVDKANPMVDIREELLAGRHRFQDTSGVFFPGASGRPQRSATNVTRPSDRWVLRRSTTKIHSASGSLSTVRAMWLTNSGSVR